MTPLRVPCYKVSEITKLIKDYIESEFYSIRIEGEVSNFKSSGSGHFYFNLKDSSAMISAVLFQNTAKNAGYIPSDGDLVIVTGNVTVYAPRGNYQIVCSYIEKAGLGNIFAELEKRKKKLAAEGLFDKERKKNIPPYPKKIGVVTSPKGAAVKDILRVLKRRNNNIDLVILPSPVQGDEAAAVIAAQIRRANMFKMCDVLIVSRGGGSPEDLLPFSDEEVVRAVADSDIPVISAVGHEIDIVLSDFAADLRAPTPSAAAEIVSGEAENMLTHIRECGESIEENIRSRLERLKLIVGSLSAEDFLRDLSGLLDTCRQRLDDAKEDASRIIGDIIVSKKHLLELLSGEFRASSPAEILKKGYASVYNKTLGSHADSAAGISCGDILEIRFWDGIAEAEAKKIGD